MPFLGWGGYMVEGLLITCGYDYLTDEWNKKSYMYFAFAFNYIMPLLFISYFYTQVHNLYGYMVNVVKVIIQMAKAVVLESTSCFLAGKVIVLIAKAAV